MTAKEPEKTVEVENIFRELFSSLMYAS